MELEYGDSRKKGRILIVLGIVLAVVAGASAFGLLTQAQQQAATNVNAATVQIVVAVNAIPARKAIGEADVILKAVPADPVYTTGVFSETAKVVGSVAGVEILAGQPVYANLLAAPGQGDTFSIMGPGETFQPEGPDWRAVSITVPDDLAVGGMINPGDRVDVLLTAVVQIPEELVTEGRYVTDRATKIVYQDLVVLTRVGEIYIVKVDLATAEELNHLQTTGQTQFSMVLRPPEDEREVDATALGETTNMIIGKYGLPLPQPLIPGRGPVRTPAPSPSPSPSPEPSASAQPSGSPAP